MDSKQEAFLKELLVDFTIEAAEHYQAIVNGLITLEQTTENKDQQRLIEVVFREMHSMKGAARAVNLLDIERLCQRVESVFHALKEEKILLSPAILDPVFKATDMLKTLLDEIGSTRKTIGANAINTLQKRLEQCLIAFPVSSPTIFPDPPKVAIPSLPAKEDHLSSPGSPTSSETIRISTSRLNTILSQAEKFISAKAALKSYLSTMRELPGQDEKLFSICSDMSDFERSFSRLIDTFIADIKTILLYPFSSILDMMPKLVRDLSREQGKEVNLSIVGRETEIDRHILEEIKDPLIHLIRNAIDHGLERPEIRKKQGKPETGILSISITQEANQHITIQVKDDGAGLNREKLLLSAKKQGLFTEESAEKLTDSAIHHLIFHSGISTSQFITDLSGRGLGMAIVSEKVVKLGGTIVVESTAGEGTTFFITLPLTLSTFNGIPVRVQDHTFLIPTTTIVQAIRVEPSAIQTIDGKAAIFFRETLTGIVALQDVLGLAQKPSKNTGSRYLQALVIQASSRRIALLVDDILGEQECIVKDLAPILGKIRNISGATVLGNGKIVLVLNIPEIIDKAISSAASDDLAVRIGVQDSPGTTLQTILVAEDSLTARSLFKNILETEGFIVTTAVDGAEAFQLLQETTVDLIVSDVEMPRMNGFELTARIRAHDTLNELPVILVTALESADDRQRGLEAGANAYINKSNFERQQLVETIHLLI